MSYDNSTLGPVAIIPAMDIRRNRDLLSSADGEPINMAYYQPQRDFNYAPVPPPNNQSRPYPVQHYGSLRPYPTQEYGTSADIAPPYPAQQYSYAPSSATSTLNRRQIYGPPAHSQTNDFKRQVLALPPRRVQQVSYAPSVAPSDTASNAWREKRIYQTRSLSTRSLLADEKIPGPVKYFSGPRKLPEPMYHKRQYYRRTFSGGQPILTDNFDSVSTVGGATSVVSSPTLARRSLVAPGSRDPGVTRDRGMERFPVDRGYIWTYSPTYTAEAPGPYYGGGSPVNDGGYYYGRRRRRNDCSLM